MTAWRAPAGGGDWFGQPRGLTVLFLTEMWEKFSYYGMRTLLIYYMTKSLLIPQSRASEIYGLYTAFVYFTPIFGAVIADRWLGRRKAVALGGIIMAIGHFMMAFETMFFPALAMIALGNGLFLPSLPSQVGALYAPGDPRGGSAYNIYYVGVNLGAFLAPLVCGFLGEIYGWHYGFGAAGIGMVIGVAIYLWGLPYLPPEPPRPARVPTTLTPDRAEVLKVFSLFVAIGACVVVFRGAYEQVGNTIALWADDGVDRSIGGGLQIPMTWFQSINALTVFLLTPPLVIWWGRRAARGKDLGPLAKMAIGASLVGCSYLLIASVAGTDAAAKPSWLWLAAFIVILTVGELFILPVGLGFFGRLAPQGFGAIAIATWFFASFGGNLLAGKLGALWSALANVEFFVLMAGVAFLAALMLFTLRAWASRVEAARIAGAVQAADEEARAPGCP